MNNKLVEQWLYERGITLEPSFVSTVKAYATKYKKRQVIVLPKYTVN